MPKKVNISDLHTLDSFNYGETIVFEGEIKKHEKLHMKSGRPYTKTKIRDTTGEYTIPLFSKQCMKVKPLLYAKCHVQITAKIERKGWDYDSGEHCLKYLSFEFDNQKIEIEE
jgi:hypothetical protein